MVAVPCEWCALGPITATHHSQGTATTSAASVAHTPLTGAAPPAGGAAPAGGVQRSISPQVLTKAWRPPPQCRQYKYLRYPQWPSSELECGEDFLLEVSCGCISSPLEAVQTSTMVSRSVSSGRVLDGSGADGKEGQSTSLIASLRRRSSIPDVSSNREGGTWRNLAFSALRRMLTLSRFSSAKTIVFIVLQPSQWLMLVRSLPRKGLASIRTRELASSCSPPAQTATSKSTEIKESECEKENLFQPGMTESGIFDSQLDVSTISVTPLDFA